MVEEPDPQAVVAIDVQCADVHRECLPAVFEEVVAERLRAGIVGEESLVVDRNPHHAVGAPADDVGLVADDRPDVALAEERLETVPVNVVDRDSAVGSDPEIAFGIGAEGDHVGRFQPHLLFGVVAEADAVEAAQSRGVPNQMNPWESCTILFTRS